VGERGYVLVTREMGRQIVQERPTIKWGGNSESDSSKTKRWKEKSEDEERDGGGRPCRFTSPIIQKKGKGRGTWNKREFWYPTKEV